MCVMNLPAEPRKKALFASMGGEEGKSDWEPERWWQRTVPGGVSHVLRCEERKVCLWRSRLSRSRRGFVRWVALLLQLAWSRMVSL